ncbi:MAG: Holliday junction resolvase RuvX [Holosporales bacterium]|jgi:putative Holliday junction resolvase|nr:Holliday junction resolvase RuvX [Holosporales bacterium]
MSPLSIESFRHLLKEPFGLVVGIDVGTRRTGLALSDMRHRFAHPWQLVSHASLKEGASAVASWIEKEDVLCLVIGWPREMSGAIGAQCRKVSKFTEDLFARVEKPFFLWDERLSTAAVIRTLREARVPYKKHGDLIDKSAATHLLQGALDLGWL